MNREDEDADILYREGIAVQRSLVGTWVGDAVRAAIETRGREVVDEMIERATEQSLSLINDGCSLRGREHLVRRAFADAYCRVASAMRGPRLCAVAAAASRLLAAAEEPDVSRRSQSVVHARMRDLRQTVDALASKDED